MHAEYYFSVESLNACCFSCCSDFTVSCSEDIAIDRDNPKWHYYFLCGVKGIQVRRVFCSSYSTVVCITVIKWCK